MLLSPGVPVPTSAISGLYKSGRLKRGDGETSISFVSSAPARAKHKKKSKSSAVNPTCVSTSVDNFVRKQCTNWPPRQRCYTNEHFIESPIVPVDGLSGDRYQHCDVVLRTHAVRKIEEALVHGCNVLRITPPTPSNVHRIAVLQEAALVHGTQNVEARYRRQLYNFLFHLRSGSALWAMASGSIDDMMVMSSMDESLMAIGSTSRIKGKREEKHIKRQDQILDAMEEETLKKRNEAGKASVLCPKCKSDLLVATTKQCRSGDEGMSNEYTCRVCKFKFMRN